jgi:DNA-binding NarL/FixJ family response regulator
MHEETTYAERALRAGASGYLMKHEAGDKLAVALRQVARGELFVSPRVHERMQRRIPPKRSALAVFPIDTLSDREREVFELIGDGYSTRQIGEQLQLSSKTIDSYRDHLKLKLGFDSGAALVRHAIEWGRTKGPL